MKILKNGLQLLEIGFEKIDKEMESGDDDRTYLRIKKT